MADILRSGALLGLHFEVLEAHIPYRLQACIDLNLYGMDLIELSEFWFRGQVPDRAERLLNGEWLPLSGDCWIASCVRADRVAADRAKQSSCMLEVDARVSNVVTARWMRRSPAVSTQSQGPLVKSLAVLWEEEAARCGGTLPTIPPTVGNAESDEAQLGECDRALRQKLLDLADGLSCAASDMIATDNIPDELLGLRMANELGLRQPTEQQIASQIQTPSQEELVDTKVLVDALLIMENDDKIDWMVASQLEALEKEERAEADNFFKDVASSQMPEEGEDLLQMDHQDTEFAVAAAASVPDYDLDDVVVLLENYEESQSLQTYALAVKPPSAKELAINILPSRSKRAYYSNPRDVQPRLRISEYRPVASSALQPFAPGHGVRLAQLAESCPIASSSLV